MYSNSNCKILQKNFDKGYSNLFMQMYIQIIYGDELVLGSTLLNDKDSEEQHE